MNAKIFGHAVLGLVGAAAGVVLVACSGSGGDAFVGLAPPPDAGGPAADAAPAVPTYHKDVEPIVQRSCQGCHTTGSIAPFNLLTYDDAKAVSGLMVARTADRIMPPWDAIETSECSPPLHWRNDARLSDAEIATIKAWHEGGDLEGDPKDAPPGKPPAVALTNPTMELVPQTAFATKGTADEFRCFVLDPKLTTTQYMTGHFIVPGNATVVHHAVFASDPNRESLKLAGPDGSYDCFGGVGVTGGTGLGVWVPGGMPTEYAPNVGTPIAAGSLIVMQIHYHAGGASAAPDLTRVQLRLTSTKPDYYLFTLGIGNYSKLMPNGDGLQPGPGDPASGPEFRIPAGATAHVERMQLTLPATIQNVPTPKMWVYGMEAHMHLAGVDMKIDVEQADATNACLLQEPRWDFTWQRMYSYDAAIESLPVWHPGDKIKLRCTYNNSFSNRQLATFYQSARVPAPKDLTLGEQTFDEMCVAIPQLVVKAP